MELVMALGSGWVIGLILGMVTGLVASLFLLKETGMQWRRQTRKEKMTHSPSSYPGDWD
jgi:gas vesicle protein